MSSTLSIATAAESSFKQSVKQWVGRTIATFSPDRAKELLDAPISQPHGLRDKAIMAYLKRHAFINNHEDFFERLHLEFWSGEGGAVFSDNCDHRFEDLFLRKQAADFAILKEAWNNCRPSEIVEFGCNSGRLIDYLTINLPGVELATGIEINEQQVARNQASTSFDSRIEFVCADGGQWLFENGRPNTLFVSNGGVLEYFKRARLDKMLTHISQHLRPAVFFAVEPVAVDHDWDSTTKSIPFGNELSFSHNYRNLFEANGFEIKHQRPVVFESWNMVATIAVTK